MIKKRTNNSVAGAIAQAIGDTRRALFKLDYSAAVLGSRRFSL